MSQTSLDLVLNNMFSMLLDRTTVPTEYHDQVKAVKDMMGNDVSGLVDSLTDFAVDTASVDIKIITQNKNLDEALAKWLKNINRAYKGEIPSGITPLSKEYYKERWKYASFPVLKVAEWKEIDGLLLPSKMFFVDGGSIYAKAKDEDSEYISLLNYNYFLGNTKRETNKLKEGTIFDRSSFGRWFDKYPKPFLIKRGVYRNWKLINKIKNHESKVLKMVVPYLLHITKGDNMGTNGVKSYSNEELTQVAKDIRDLFQEIKADSVENGRTNKMGVRATNFDEEIKHLIPDLKSIFEPQLFANAERNILSGLGFIDVVEATSTSRRESILNPKAFVEQVKSGVKDFKQVLKDLFILIEEKNEKHTKYMNQDIKIVSSPVRGFMTDKFKQQIRQLYDRGRISSQTAVELIAETDFETEILRREREGEQDIEKKMYPVVTKNMEDKQHLEDHPTKKEEDTKDRDIPEDKKDPTEKQEYDIGEKELRGAPYDKIKELPKSVKDNMSKSLQGVWMNAFNSAYEEHGDDNTASKIAWSAVKQVAHKNKDGKWVRNRGERLQDSDLEELIKGDK